MGVKMHMVEQGFAIFKYFIRGSGKRKQHFILNEPADLYIIKKY